MVRRDPLVRQVGGRRPRRVGPNRSDRDPAACLTIICRSVCRDCPYAAVMSLGAGRHRAVGEELAETLEAQGQLHAMLLEAEEKTKDEMIELTQQFRKQGLTAQQAHDRAWEMVRESYILLPAES